MGFDFLQRGAFFGRGSNVLVPDEGVRGVVVSLSSQAFLRLEVQDHHLCAGVGVPAQADLREGPSTWFVRAGIPGERFLDVSGEL